MTQTNQPNIALVRKIFRETIVFAAAPTAETIRLLKRNGYEYRNGQWTRGNSENLTTDEQFVVSELSA